MTLCNVVSRDNIERYGMVLRAIGVVSRARNNILTLHFDILGSTAHLFSLHIRHPPRASRCAAPDNYSRARRIREWSGGKAGSVRIGSSIIRTFYYSIR